MGDVRMRQLIERTFNDTVAFLPRELKKMPLGRWSEGVFRYFFCRFLSNADRGVIQHVECNHIDLVVRGTRETAFVEFKFYWRPPRFNPKTGERCGFKGGPGRKNLSEFRKCVKELAGRPESVQKYVVLFYADPPATLRQKNSFARFYGDYRHGDQRIAVQRLAKKSFDADKHAVTCQLFEISRSGPGAAHSLNKR